MRLKAMVLKVTFWKYDELLAKSTIQEMMKLEGKTKMGGVELREAWETEEKGEGSLRGIEGKSERWGREWNWHKKKEEIRG
jgi:hypothetical protein